MTVKLPEWCDDVDSIGMPVQEGIDKLREALTIAIEAMDRVDQMCICSDNGAICDGCIIGKALLRIAALGGKE